MKKLNKRAKKEALKKAYYEELAKIGIKDTDEPKKVVKTATKKASTKKADN